MNLGSSDLLLTQSCHRPPLIRLRIEGPWTVELGRGICRVREVGSFLALGRPAIDWTCSRCIFTTLRQRVSWRSIAVQSEEASCSCLLNPARNAPKLKPAGGQREQRGTNKQDGASHLITSVYFALAARRGTQISSSASSSRLYIALSPDPAAISFITTRRDCDLVPLHH